MNAISFPTFLWSLRSCQRLHRVCRETVIPMWSAGAISSTSRQVVALRTVLCYIEDDGLYSNGKGSRFQQSPGVCPYRTLLAPQHLTVKNNNILRQCIGADDNVHVVFIGDSVMGLEYRAFNAMLYEATTSGKRITTSAIGTHGGLAKELGVAIETLEDMQEDVKDQKRLIIFNPGLHNIAQLCSVKYKEMQRENLDVDDGAFSCIEMYKSLLHDFIALLANYPADLIAFRTTIAPVGYCTIMWDLHGSQPSKYQPYSVSPNFVAHMNGIAKGVVEPIGDKIPILDGYYITLPRPDHREVDKDNTIGKHLVHPGPQVVEAMAGMWFNVVLRTLCSDIVDGWSMEGIGKYSHEDKVQKAVP